jgi:hypothetical protein
MKERGESSLRWLGQILEQRLATLRETHAAARLVRALRSSEAGFEGGTLVPFKIGGTQIQFRVEKALEANEQERLISALSEGLDDPPLRIRLRQGAIAAALVLLVAGAIALGFRIVRRGQTSQRQ